MSLYVKDIEEHKPIGVLAAAHTLVDTLDIMANAVREIEERLVGRSRVASFDNHPVPTSQSTGNDPATRTPEFVSVARRLEQANERAHVARSALDQLMHDLLHGMEDRLPPAAERINEVDRMGYRPDKYER